jgi:hypothetical protein
VRRTLRNSRLRNVRDGLYGWRTPKSLASRGIDTSRPFKVSATFARERHAGEPDSDQSTMNVQLSQAPSSQAMASPVPDEEVIFLGTEETAPPLPNSQNEGGGAWAGGGGDSRNAPNSPFGLRTIDLFEAERVVGSHLVEDNSYRYWGTAVPTADRLRTARALDNGLVGCC